MSRRAKRACRVCGCTQTSACLIPLTPGGLPGSEHRACGWAERDLCDNPSCIEAIHGPQEPDLDAMDPDEREGYLIGQRAALDGMDLPDGAYFGMADEMGIEP